jgi:hypothetical protein
MCWPLNQKAPKVEQGLAVLGQLVQRGGVLRDVHADSADSSGEPHRRDQVVQRGGIVFMASRVVRLGWRSTTMTLDALMVVAESARGAERADFGKLLVRVS